MRYYLLVIALPVLLASCTNIVAKSVGLTETKPIVKELSVNGKEVIFLGMRHLGKQEFYNETKLVIDRLVKESYTIYVESVGAFKDGKLYTDTVALKKIRKITGNDLSVNYADKPSLKPFVEKLQLIGQPDYKDLGATDIKVVDLPYTSLLQVYESLYGEVKLDTCDILNSLGKFSYPCQTLSKKQYRIFKKKILITERNKFIAESISNSTDNKILLIYGFKHYKGIKKELQKLN